ncbi:MAG: acyltransferase family protein [Burkholderiales bacterium]|nr:acyltransferase family protein [Burkholderiales bacterium]
MSLTISTPGRNASIDNIKAVLIFLVVFGHLFETYVGNDHFLRSIWIFVYSFHMPMFALVSGMFSKPLLDERQTGQLLKNIVIPLVGFELLYEGTEFLLKGNVSVYANLVAPYWMLWYLLSLLCWRLLLPLFARMQFPVMLALALSLAAGYSEHAGYFLSLSRTLIFFPYFLLGWKIGPDAVLAKKNNLLLVSLPLVGLAIVASFLLKPNFDYRWLYGSYSLHRLEMANLSGTLYQGLQYLISTAVGLSVLHVLTRKDLGLARIGQRSMYVFLWHGMALIALQESGLLRRIFAMEDAAALLISLSITAAIVWLSSHPRCEQLTQKCLLHPLAWLLTRQTGQSLAPKSGELHDQPAQLEP